MTRRQKKAAEPVAPRTPEQRAGFRDPDHVKSVVLRMGTEFIERLDELCEVNKRSRRELIEILIAYESLALQEDPSTRINPL